LRHDGCTFRSLIDAMVKLLENIWIKVVALLMGLLLWFHVATEKVYKYRLSLPITDIVLGERLTLVDAPPDSMTVVVSASGKQLLRQKWRERGMKISATQLSIGHHTINLTTANTSLAGAGSFMILDEVVSPTSMLLYVDYTAETQVEVAPDITAIPDEGFSIKRISNPDPEEITLIGARSQVRKVTTVSTEPRKLTGLRDNLMLTLPLVGPAGYQMTLKPDSVTITIEIVAVKTKVFEDIPIVVYNAPSGKAVSTQPSALRIELTGPPEDIDLLSREALIASVDFRRFDSNGISPIKIDCPSNFKVKKISVNTVRIIVQ
jgi:YbbR domain-containing protein